jgi:hypothetical protein
MKLPALLLAGSLAANAALLFVYCGRGDPTPLPAPVSTSPASNSPPAAAASILPAGVPPNTWSALDTPDLRELVARLRATGFSPRVIRAIIDARVYEKFTGVYLDLLPPESEFSFWQPSRELFPGYDEKVMPALIAFWNQQTPITEELIASLSPEEASVHAAKLRRDFGDLPREKIDRIRQLNEDYYALSREVRSVADGLKLPEDDAKLALLEREKQADLAALLTPAELAAYEFAKTPVPYGLRRAFTVMDATEAEYRSLAPYLKTIAVDQPDAATTALAAAQAKAALGEVRYAEFLRASDREFQQLTYLTQQANLPAPTAVQALTARDTAVQESNRIAQDTTLTYEQKRAALATLAQNTRAQLTATLGPAAPTYLTFAEKWLNGLASGNTVTFTPTKPVVTPLPQPGT